MSPSCYYCDLSYGPFLCDERDSQKGIFEGKSHKNLNFK